MCLKAAFTNSLKALHSGYYRLSYLILRNILLLRYYQVLEMVASKLFVNDNGC